VLDNTIEDVGFTEVNEIKNLDIAYKDGSAEHIVDFDIYGVNSGVIIIGYANGSFMHINLDLVSSFLYSITKE
jgi:hypothetical protein